MSREELQQKSRFAMIGTLMTIVSLVFLFYVGSSLVNTTTVSYTHLTLPTNSLV